METPPSKVQIKDSITMKLLKAVFGLYLIVAFSATVIHMIAEYRNTKENILSDLKIFQQTFEPGLAVAIWNIDDELIRNTVSGIMKVPIIIGVRVLDGYENELIVVGQNNSPSEELLPSSEHKQSVVSDNPTPILFHQIFGHTFPVYYKEMISIPIGRVTFYSSNQVVLQKVQYGFLFILFNSLIKTAALWIIFLLIGRSMLGRPLAILTTATSQIEMGNLDDIQIDVQTSGRNELKLLEETFNNMVRNLSVARVEIHQRLQNLVEDITMIIETDEDKLAILLLTCQSILEHTSLPHLSQVRFYFRETDPQGEHHFRYFKLSVIPGDPPTLDQPLSARKQQQSFAENEFIKKMAIFSDVLGRRYLISNQTLCISIDHRSECLGLLEFVGVPEASFSANDAHTIHILAHTLAVSLKNLDFVIGLENQIEERTAELKKTHTRLIASEKQATLSQLAAGIAHEINNPINYIAAALIPIRRELVHFQKSLFDLFDPEDITEESLMIQEQFKKQFMTLGTSLSDMNTGVKQASLIVQTIRRLTEVDGMIKENIHIKEILTDNWNKLVASCDKGMIIPAFTLNVPESLRYNGNPVVLENAIHHLLRNGIFYAGQKEHPQIKVEALQRGTQILIEISNNGPAIHKDIEHRIFDMFFTTRSIGEAKGIGLSLAKTLIHHHNGDLLLSDNGLSSEWVTFQIHLPCDKEEAES